MCSLHSHHLEFIVNTVWKSSQISCSSRTHWRAAPKSTNAFNWVMNMHTRTHTDTHTPITPTSKNPMYCLKKMISHEPGTNEHTAKDISMWDKINWWGEMMTCRMFMMTCTSFMMTSVGLTSQQLRSTDTSFRLGLLARPSRRALKQYEYRQFKKGII